jgi:hypothetical protein
MSHTEWQNLFTGANIAGSIPANLPMLPKFDENLSRTQYETWFNQKIFVCPSYLLDLRDFASISFAQKFWIKNPIFCLHLSAERQEQIILIFRYVGFCGRSRMFLSMFHPSPAGVIYREYCISTLVLLLN